MLDIIVELANGTERETATKKQLLALLKKYDLQRFVSAGDTLRGKHERGTLGHG